MPATDPPSANESLDIRDKDGNSDCPAAISQIASIDRSSAKLSVFDSEFLCAITGRYTADGRTGDSMDCLECGQRSRYFPLLRVRKSALLSFWPYASTQRIVVTRR